MSALLPSVSDAHEGLKAAVAKLLNAAWQRCRVHFARNALAYAGKNGRRVMAAFIAPPLLRTTPRPPSSSGALAEPCARRACDTASSALRSMVADQLRSTLPKLAAFPRRRWRRRPCGTGLIALRSMDEAEADVLAYMAFPAQHQP